MTELFAVSLTVKKCLHVNKNPNSSHQRNDNKICGIYLIKERERIKNISFPVLDGKEEQTRRKSNTSQIMSPPGRVNEQS